MVRETVKIDINDLQDKYPNSEWPCLRYSEELLKTGYQPNTRLEVWNYNRKIPEADWVVENIGFYAENALLSKKNGIKHRPFEIG